MDTSPARPRSRSRSQIIVEILAVAALLAPAGAAKGDIPQAFKTPGEVVVASLHAEGAQVYECKTNASGALVWQFREPIATLIENGKTVGFHYAGPHWRHADGSIVAGKVADRAPAATPQDIPLLKLEVTTRSGNGVFSDVTAILRIDTRGGVAEGACPAAGAFLSAPYAARYVFVRKDKQATR